MLTRCPSCQASVLDDDAEVCPFCGSPMDPAKAKGFQPAAKPTEKPAKPKPKPASPAAKEKRPAAKPSGTRPKAPAASSGTATRSSKPEDPFAVDPSAIAGVTPLSTKRSESRPQKIVCPMCDTVGYAPVSASGKDVRCANPKCMVPVFTAPDFAAPKRELLEPSSSKGTVLTLVGIAVVVLGGGFAYWWLNFRAPEARQRVPNVVAPVPSTPTSPAPEDTEPAETGIPIVPATAAEVRERALERWSKATETVADIQRRSVRLRHAAESYAIAGNVEQAQTFLAEIDKGGDRDRFDKIGPLAEIVWAKLEAGDEAGAQASFEELAGLSDAIPNQGFEPARAVILWASAAARFGDAGKAHELASTRRDEPAGERLLASLETAAVLAEFDLYSNHAWRPVLAWSAPKSVGVAMNLLRHQQPDVARSWGEGATSPTAQAETLGAWAEGQVGGEGGADAIRVAIGPLDPAVKLYVASRAALRAIARKDTPTAEALFADIESTANNIAAAEPLPATTAGELHSINLSEAAEERLRGAAFAEAAHVAARLNKPELANGLLWRAADHLRATAPSVVDITAREQEFKSADVSGIRGTLKSELGLNDSAAEGAAIEYRRKLPDYRAAADAAFLAQGRILARGVEWGLGEPIFTEIQKRDAAAGEGQKYLAGSTGGRIWAAYQQAGNSKTAATIRAAGVTNRDVPLDAGMELVILPLVEQEKSAEAGQQFVAGTWSRIPDDERLAFGLRIVTRLAGEKKHAQIAEFLRPISDDDDRGEMYRAWGGRAAATNQGMAFLEQIGKARMSITTLASALRGLAAGLEVLPDATPPSEENGEPAEGESGETTQGV